MPQQPVHSTAPAGAGEIPKRTPEIIIRRQLWPAPPRDARPCWCYINTLIFYDAHHREVWRQEIPEAGIFLPRFERFFRCEVEREPHYGWMLRIEASHGLGKMLIGSAMRRARRHACETRELHRPRTNAEANA